MKKRIFVYIFISQCLLVALPAQAQVDTSRYGGIRFNLDLARVPGWFMTPAEKSVEVLLDAEIKDGWFLVAEGGNASLAFEKYNYILSSDGNFLRLGFDRNFLKRSYNENEIIFWGARIGGSRFTQQATNVLIPSEYWGDLVTTTPTETINAVWLELAVGIRAELFHNFFIGWGVRSRLFLQLSDHVTSPYYVPGYGNTLKNSALGFQYIIAYRIPYKLKQ